MKKPANKYRTHIPEPRWQQIASVIVVVACAAAWLWLVFRSR